MRKWMFTGLSLSLRSLKKMFFCSYGILLWEIMSGKEWDGNVVYDGTIGIYELEENFVKHVVEGMRPKIPEYFFCFLEDNLFVVIHLFTRDWPDELNRLLQNCWSNDPDERISFKEIVPR
jgi:hypothetical protein